MLLRRLGSCRAWSTLAITNPLAPFLAAQGTVVADGGFGGAALGPQARQHRLLGAQMLFTRDGHVQIERVHREFLEAGADVISTASYKASFEFFEQAGAFASLPGGAITKTAHKLRYSRDCLRTSVELAKQARDAFWTEGPTARRAGRLRPLVAASVGPAGDWLQLGTADTATDAADAAVHALSDEQAAPRYPSPPPSPAPYPFHQPAPLPRFVH